MLYVWMVLFAIICINLSGVFTASEFAVVIRLQPTALEQLRSRKKIILHALHSGGCLAPMFLKQRFEIAARYS